MTKGNGSDVEADQVLPSSRQAMPGSEEFTTPRGRPVARRNGDAGEKRRKGVAEIEAELEASADRLADNVDALVGRLHPREITRRSVNNVKTLATTSTGGPRAEVIGAAVGALAGVALMVWLARRRK